jgi:hypothetical protein
VARDAGVRVLQNPGKSADRRGPVFSNLDWRSYRYINQLFIDTIPLDI